MSADETLEDLDKIYFRPQASWEERLDLWLDERRSTTLEKFIRANESVIGFSVTRGELALRMVVNIPAEALLGFLGDKKYKNGYERSREIGGKPVGGTRFAVDDAIFADTPDESPEHYYFGAVALSGAGVRFYGEYCLVLDEAAIDETTQIMDRNSWFIEFPPLVGRGSREEIAERLKGQWARDVLAIAKLKVLPQLDPTVRLATTGVVGEGILGDESFIEVHKRRTFTPADVKEVRETPADAAIESHVVQRRERGHAPRPEEWLWVIRRGTVASALASGGIRSRVVATYGRVRS